MELAKTGVARRRRLVVIAAAVGFALVMGAGAWVVDHQRPDSPGEPAKTKLSAVQVPAAVAAAAEAKMLVEVDRILKARAAALLAGDLPGYLRDVDTGKAKFVQRDQVVFANLRKIGLSKFSYVREPGFVPEKVQKGTANAWAIRLVMVVQIAGIDAAPRVTPLGYTFAKQDDRWVLAADDDLAGESDRGDYTEPWDLGTIDVARGAGVLVIVPAGEGDNARRLVQAAGIAMPAVRTATRRAQEKILVIAMADERSMDPDWATGGHPASAVAVPNYSPTDAAMTDFEVTGSRVVINPDERDEADDLLLAHEFTHAALSTLGEYAPTWLVEGFATYVEEHLAEETGNDDEVDEWRQELLEDSIPALVVLPIDGVFHGEFDEDSYGIGWIATEYLVTKYGLPAVNAFYAETSGGTDDPAFREQALRNHFELTEAALVAALKKYTGPS